MSFRISQGFRLGGNLLYGKDFMLSGQGVPAPYPAVAIRLGKRDVVALVAGTRLVTLDPASGGLQAPAHDLGFWPIRTPQFTDLDGDGETDVLLLGPGPDTKPPGESPMGIPPSRPQRKPEPLEDEAGPGSQDPPNDDQLTLTAFALSTGLPLWRQTLRALTGVGTGAKRRSIGRGWPTSKALAGRT